MSVPEMTAAPGFLTGPVPAFPLSIILVLRPSRTSRVLQVHMRMYLVPAFVCRVRGAGAGVCASARGVRTITGWVCLLEPGEVSGEGGGGGGENAECYSGRATSVRCSRHIWHMWQLWRCTNIRMQKMDSTKYGVTSGAGRADR